MDDRKHIMFPFLSDKIFSKNSERVDGCIIKDRDGLQAGGKDHLFALFILPLRGTAADRHKSIFYGKLCTLSEIIKNHLEQSCLEDFRFHLKPCSACIFRDYAVNTE